MVIAVDATRQYTVPKFGKSGPSLVLAIAMHVLLALFLYFGISWQSHPPEAIEAEMWSQLPQIAAPKQAPPEPVPVREQPVQVVPPPELPPIKPDIVIKDPVKKPEIKPPPPAPPPPPPRVEPKPVPPPLKVAPPAPSQRNFDFDPVKPSTGTAAVTSGPQGSPGYANKIAAWVRPHVHSTAEGNPQVLVTIQLLPSGEVRDVQVKVPSGDPTFDDQAVKGVYASSPIPKDVDGKIPSTMEIHISNK